MPTIDTPLSQARLELLRRVQHEPGRTSKQYLQAVPGSTIDDLLDLLDDDLLSIDLRHEQHDIKPRPQITELGKGVVAYAVASGRIE